MSQNNPAVILIVNDSPDQREMLEMFLRQADYRVLAAADGRQGFEIARREKPDMVISDVIMPESDGIELCRRIRADEQLRAMPVMLVSGIRKDIDSVVEGLETGADDYMELPFEPMHMIARVARLLERKRVEDLLRESEIYYRSLIENITDLISILSLDGTILYESLSISEVLGYEPNELLGKNAFDLVHPEDREQVLSFFKDSVRRIEASQLIEYRFKNGTGEWRIIESSGKIIQNQQAETVVIINSRDVTERRQADALVHFQKTLLESQSESSIDGILVVGQAGEILFHNRRFIEIWGISEETIAARSDRMTIQAVIDKIVAPDEFLKTLDYLYGHPHVKDQVEINLKDGRILERYTAPVIDADGVYYGRIWYFRDITKRKRAEQKIRESEASLANAQRLAHIGSWDWDIPNDRIVWSDEHYKIFGLTTDEFANKYDSFIRRVHPDDHEKAQAVLADAMAQLKSYDVEFRILRPDGEERIVHAVGEITFDESGKPMQMAGTVQDITERRRAEDSIRFQAQLLDTVEQAVIAADLEGRIIYWNQFAEHLYGWSKGEAVGTTIRDLMILEPDWERSERVMSQLYQGESWTGELSVCDRGGRNFPIQISCSTIYDAAGKISGILGVSVDIRERKRIDEEKARLAAEIESERLRIDTIIANVPGIVWETRFGDGIEQSIFFVSDYAETISGYAVEEWDTNRDLWFRIIHPDDKEKARQHFESLLNNESGPAQQYRWVRKDGRIIWVETQMVTLRDERGEPLGIRGVTIDITERKEAESAIAEANERAIREYDRLLQRLGTLAETVGTARDINAVFNGILNFATASVPCSVLLITLCNREKTSREFIYMWYNGEQVNVDHLEGAPVNAGIVGQAIKSGEIVIANDYLETLKNSATVISLGFEDDPRQPRSALIAPMKIKGDTIGTIEIQSYELGAYQNEHATAMRMAANLAANAIENVRLLEQERQREEQLRHSQKLESVGRLAGGIAHDFNNMLTAINGYSELLLRRMETGNPLRRNVEEIKKAGERSASLTHQLLAFSRRQVLQPKIVDLNEIVAETIQMLKRLIGEDVRLETMLDQNLGRVAADPGQLTQVVMNLAVNARDAMPQGGRLVIKTANVYLDDDFASRFVPTQPGAYVLLSVRDDGVGIDGETLQHIFEPFYTTKEVGKGTGLGLPTVYGIVKQSGGYIWVESEPGEGSTFKVYLPRIEEASSVEEAKDSNYTAGAAETILIAEDEDMVRALTRQILEECGYRVLEARDGAEAVAVCREHNCRIDLVITDVVMPRMGGREVARRINEMCPQVPILFTSGYTDDAAIRRDITETEANFIQKPFTFDALARKVNELLTSEKTAKVAGPASSTPNPRLNSDD